MTTILFVHPQQHVCDKIAYILSPHCTVKTAVSFEMVANEDLLQCTHIIVDKQVSVPTNVSYMTCSFSSKNDLSYIAPITEWLTELKQPLIKAQHTSDNMPSVSPDNQVITFMGVRGNVGTTTLSWACASYLKQFGTVFYLSLSPLQQTLDSAIDKHATFSMVLTAIKTNQSIRLKDVVVHWQDVMTFVPSVDRFDYTAVNKADIVELLNMIKVQLNCNYIIIDTLLTDVLYKTELVSNSHKVFIVDGKEQCHSVQSLFMNFMESECIQLDKVYYVLNQHAHSTQQYDIIIPLFEQPVSHHINQFLYNVWQVYL